MADRESPGPGIRWDATRQQWRAFVEVGSGAGRTGGRLTTSRRFPDATPVREMKLWQDAAREQLRAQGRQGRLHHASRGDATATPVPETLAQAAKAYLKTISAMPSADTRGHDLRAWVAVLGDVPVTSLTARDLAGVWNTWRAKPFAASTLNHRRTALLGCLKLCAPSMVALVRDTLPRASEHSDVPRELAYADITDILQAMPAGKGRALLKVFATTGHPPATLRRLTRDSIDLRRGTVRLPARQKGRSVPGVVLPLTPAAVEAFREFIEADAWGGVRGQTLAIIWGRAVATVNAAREKAGLPLVPPCTPYHLRHSFAGLVLDATGGDLQATKELLQHADLETTLRYARGRITRSVEAAAKAVGQIQPSLSIPERTRPESS